MNRFIFIIFSLFVLGISSVFAQSSLLLSDLERTFRNYELAQLDNRVVLQKAKTGQIIQLQAKGRSFEFVLVPNDIRADNYLALETTPGGDYELPPTGVITYKGILLNNHGSEVRFTLTDEMLEGFIYTSDSEKIFINQAKRFSSGASKSDVVIYGENDLLKRVNLSDDIEGKMDFGFDTTRSGSVDETTAADNQWIPQTGAATAELRQLEVATEADYQWVSQAGGATQANNEILGIMNNVDAIYRRDLNLTVKVTFQHAWSSADSFPGGSMSPLLDAFINHWNANYPNSQYPRDVAHLFTGKLSNQGLAYIGVICRNSSYAYGLTARSGSVNHLITAHEIGHNLGADHVDNSGACASSMMNPSVGPNVTGFCDASKNTIANFVANSGSCLSVVGTTQPTPTPTPTFTPTPTPYPTITPTPTPKTPTPTPTVMPTPYPTPTPNPFPTATPTPNPTPAGPVNVALASNGGRASASSQSSSVYAASLAINGTRSWGNGGGWRDATLNTFPDWLQVDFNGSKSINEISVYGVRDDYSSPYDPTAAETSSLYGITSFDVQYWNGSSWVTVPGGSITGNNKVITKITFATITTSKIRVVVNAGQGGYSRIVEVEAWTGTTTGNPTPTPTPISTPTPNPTPISTPTPTPTPIATPTPNPTPISTPTPPPTPSVRTNVALASNGGVATASSESSSLYAASLANNGGRTWGSGGGWRDGTINGYPDWLQIAFNGSKTINEIVVYGVKDDYLSTLEPSVNETFSIYGLTSFDVQYWNGSAWATVPGGNVTNNNRVVTKIAFTPVTTTKIRVIVNGALAGYSRVVEVEAWSN